MFSIGVTINCYRLVTTVNNRVVINLFNFIILVSVIFGIIIFDMITTRVVVIIDVSVGRGKSGVITIFIIPSPIIWSNPYIRIIS